MNDGADRWVCGVCRATGYESLSSLAGHQKVCPGLIAPSDGGVAEFGRLAEKSHRMYAGPQVAPQGEPWRPRVGDVCRTRDGRRARVVADDRSGRYPVVALVMDEDGSEGVLSYQIDGKTRALGLDSQDLCPPVRRQRAWVNVYDDGPGVPLLVLGIYGYREDADVGAGEITPKMARRVACIAIDIEEGRFDE